MNRFFRSTSIAAVASIIALLSAGATHAQPTQPDPDQRGSLTLYKHVQDEQHSSPGSPAGEPLVGIEFTLTEVLADGQSLAMATTEGWKLAESVIDGDAPALPEGFTLGEATVATTGTGGAATFTNLPLGLYLVTETGFGDNNVVEPMTPFWVSVPTLDAEGAWVYDIVAHPKNLITAPTPEPSPEPTPTTPEPTPDPEPEPTPTDDPTAGIPTGIPGMDRINPALMLIGGALLAGAGTLVFLGIRRSTRSANDTARTNG